MRFLGGKSRSIVGIDIGTHSIKLVELGGSMAKPQVLAWGIAQLPVGAFSENTIANPEVIADVLSGLIAKSGAKSDQIAVSISSSHAITKVLNMPGDLSEVELEEQVSIEALHFIPYPIDEVNIDFEVLGTSKTSDQESDVLLVACRRSIVNDYIDLINDLSLELRYVDIDTYALERVFRSLRKLSSRSREIVALFDIGSSSSHLMILDKERVIYSRHQNFGAAQLIKLVRKEYGVSLEAAEEILHSSQPPDDFASAVQEPFTEMLGQEVNRALQFFYSSSSYSEVDSVVLSGSAASLSDLASGLQSKIRTKVSVLDPIENASVHFNRSAISAKASGLSLAYGLSLRGLK